MEKKYKSQNYPVCDAVKLCYLLTIMYLDSLLVSLNLIKCNKKIYLCNSYYFNVDLI